ncbi:MAG: hypothetical protein WD768_16505 [Phycisphaeraceae bacterium]
MARTSEQSVKRIRIGDYLAEVPVEFHYDDGKDYSPTLSAADALRVERVFKALKRGDIAAAAIDASVYRLTPVSAA